MPVTARKEYGIFAKHYYRMVYGASCFCVFVNLIREFGKFACGGDVFCLTDEFVNPRAHNFYLWESAECFKLLFKTVVTGDIIGIHPCHKLIGTMFKPFVEGFPETSVFFSGTVFNSW